MNIVYFVRHAKQDNRPIETHGVCQRNAPLNQQGFEEAERLRAYFADKQDLIDDIYISGVVRSTQTGTIAFPRRRLDVMPELWVSDEARWDRLYVGIPPEEHMTTIQAIEQADPGIVTVDTERLSHAIRKAFSKVSFDHAMVVIGHQPLIEAVIHYFHPQYPPDTQTLKTGDIVELMFFTNGRFYSGRVIRQNDLP